MKSSEEGTQWQGRMKDEVVAKLMKDEGKVAFNWLTEVYCTKGLMLLGS